MLKSVQCRLVVITATALLLLRCASSPPVAARAAAPSPSDLTFIDSMLAHHAQNGDLALAARERASDAAVKALAEEILHNDSTERKKLLRLRARLFPDVPRAAPPKAAAADLYHLDRAAFDRIFLERLAARHDQGVAMAWSAARSTTPEVAALARQIAQTESSERDRVRALLQGLN